MKLYTGTRRPDGTLAVDVDGLPLNGYGGSGPAQLALAILADCLGPELAVEYYQMFKFDVVAGLAYEGFTISEDQVRIWLQPASRNREFGIWNLE